MITVRIIAPSRDFRYQAKHPLDLAEVLAAKNFHVEVLAPMRPEVIAIHANRGFKITRLPSMFSSFIRGEAVARSLLGGLPPTAVTIGIDTPGLLVAHMLKRLRLTNVLVYYAMELSLPEDCYGQKSVWYQTRCINDSDMVVTTGPERAEIMHQRFSLKSLPFILRNTLVLGGPVKCGTLREALQARNIVAPERCVVFSGFLSERTGLPNIVESMTLWPPNTGLVLLGQGSPEFLDHLVAIARKNRCADRLIALGAVAPGWDAMSSLIAGASIGIATRKYKSGTLNEKYYDPTKLFEYAAVGVPVLCSDQHSLEFVQDEDWGVCVDPESPARIGAAVSKMLSDPKTLERMGRTARRLFEERYCMERQVQPIVSALSHLTAGRAS